MALTDFENLLKVAIGLDVASIGPSSIERAVQARLSACGLPSRDVYWERVRASATELQSLIEAVVVSETWFFRDREAFATLASIGHEAWRHASAGVMMRLLSLPCSTGEEPYSMAMALLDAGVPGDWFRIDAVDVSAQAIARAERAVYGRNSFRGQELAFRHRHFDATTLGYRPSDIVRRRVILRQGNILSAEFLQGLEIYDVIFCRNLLIYFDRPTQSRVIDVIRRLLTPTGTLFVAPSEAALLLSHGFASAKIPLAFAYHKSAAAQPAPAQPSHTPSAPPAFALAPRAASARHASTFALAPQIASAQQTPRHSGLDEAVRLADQGSFAEATSYCEAHLKSQGPSAEAFYLLGLVRDAAGNAPDASNYYRKAIYLDPAHHEALVHLAFLVEQQGNSAAAKVLRNRARRVRQHEA